jgi:nanoRNase/pAp phosphatase (c-di-AMP/oligoRNAs hydrolase)
LAFLVVPFHFSKGLDVDIAERIERMRMVFKTNPGLCRIIVTQIDPDSMGAAYCLKQILEIAFQRQTRICYCGKIGHPQNKYIFKRYNLGEYFFPIEEEQDADQGLIIFVDSCSLNDRRLPAGKCFSPKIIIDHHREERGLIVDNGDKMVWIEDVGAASTLVCELCQVVDASILNIKEVALLLAFGIHSDTKGLIFGGRRDHRAHMLLLERCDLEERMKVSLFTIPASFCQQFETALANKRIKGSRLVTGVGIVAEEDGDNISTIADYLIRRDGTHIVVVWAIIGNFVRISARSRDYKVPLDEFLRSVFRNGGAKITPEGYGEGGARLKLSLTGFSSIPCESNSVVGKVSQNMVKRVFDFHLSPVKC